MKAITSILLLVIGFFIGMIAERLIYPRTVDVVATENLEKAPTKQELDLAKIEANLLGFDFKGMSNERQEITVSEPVDFCIKSQDEAGNYILGVGVTTRVIGDRPPDMPEMMHSYWLFKMLVENDEAKIIESIPTFSYDCKWIDFEELQKEADPEAAEE